MTTKQISEAVGKPERTVKGWATRLGAKDASAGAKLASAGHGKAADWSLDEAIGIVEIGMGKNAASLFRENAERTQNAPQNAEVGSDRIARLESLVEKVLGALVAVIPQQAQMRASLPAPAKLTARDELRRVIANAAAKDKDYQAKWNLLYEEDYYRNHRNIRLCAKNARKPVIDYADEEGIIEDLLAIAYELFGEAA